MLRGCTCWIPGITPPGPTSPVSNARAWKEFPKHHLESLVPRPGPADWSSDSNHWAHHPGSHAGSGKTWEEIEVLCGILTTLACLGFLVLLTSQDPGFSRSGEAVIPSTPMGSGLWNINTKNWAEWGSMLLLLSHYSHVRLCATPETAAH